MKTHDSMDSVARILDEALSGDAFRLLILSKPTPDATERGLQKMTVRQVALNGSRRFQIAVRTRDQEKQTNVDGADLKRRVVKSLGQQFCHLHLYTAEADISIRINRKGAVRIRRNKPSMLDMPEQSHNRQRHYLIPDNQPCDFLIDVGIMTRTGQVRKSMYHKFRQMNRYVEFINDIVDRLPPEGCINVVDFGCGKSYLTFATHYLLTAIHGRQVNIVGLDRRDDVVETCTAIVERLKLHGMRFKVCDISEFTINEPVHLAISLHACDTATDDAIARAIEWQSDVILAVPCCQHELSDQIDNGLLEPITRHGILRERFAALATDALRAQALELCGYRSQVLEFIDMEHTAKNLLIRAVRRDGQPAADHAELARNDHDFRSLLGITSCRIDSVLSDRTPVEEVVA